MADGLWRDARELLLSRRRSGRRASVLRPQERLAVLLSGRERVLLCEELTLRARLDLDAGRLPLAAIELERAYAAALGELSEEGRSDLRERIDELAGLRDGVERNARAALPEAPPASDAATNPTACTDTVARGTDTDAPGGAPRARARAYVRVRGHPPRRARPADSDPRAGAPGSGAARAHRVRILPAEVSHAAGAKRRDDDRRLVVERRRWTPRERRSAREATGVRRRGGYIFFGDLPL